MKLRILHVFFVISLNVMVAESRDPLESGDPIIRADVKPPSEGGGGGGGGPDEGGGREVRAKPYEDRPPSCDQYCRTESTPYVATILSKTSGNFLCMGSILAPRHVLTVRECLLRDDVKDILVMGGYMGAWWGRNAQVNRVQEVVKSDEDLAILKLRKKFLFTKTIKPIKISANDPLFPHETYGNQYGVVGFNRAPWDVPGEPMPKMAFYELRFGTLMVEEDMDKCKEAYADINFNDTTMFCTYENTTYCWGNLGSPSVVLMDEQLVQMGIVVRAYCDEKRIPNLHVRIDAYEGWIRSNSDAKMNRL